MAIIKKTIKGLKPGADYIFTTKPKNTEISASDDLPDAIRLTVPLYSQEPESVFNLQIVSRFETLFFKFDPVNDVDLDYYEYQIFENSSGTGSPLNASLSLVGDGSYISGFSKASFFTVSVENSNSGATPDFKNYWGRVRAVNTSRVASLDWSNLVEAGDTPLIGEDYILSLNAGKITTGTLQGATINMDGSASIIKSSNYNFSAATPNGWYIRGDGHLNFGGPFGITYNGSTVTIGTAVNVQANLSANSLVVGNGTYGYLTVDSGIGLGNSDFGIELGDTTYNYWYANGNFSVGKDADNYLSFNSQGLTIKTGGPNSGLKVDKDGKVWAGDANFSNNAEFRMDESGRVTIGVGNAAGTPLIPGGPNTTESLRINGEARISGKLTINGSTTDVSGDLNVAGKTTLTGEITTQNKINAQSKVVANLIQSHDTVPQTGPNVISWQIKTDGVNTGFYGYLGLGSTSQQIIKVGSEINVSGNITAAQANFIHTSGQATIRATRSYSLSGGNTRLIAFINQDSGNAVGGIEFNSATSVAYRTTSDERLKIEIKKEFNSLEKMLKIDPKLFYWKNDKDKKQFLGLFAQKVYEVYPQAVSVGSNNENENPWMIDYSSLIPLIIGSIKELASRIDALE